MAENITLISKEYAGGVFQSKLTEANQGDNIKITGEGKNLKISAEVPPHTQTTITTSDERVVVNETETGYDLALNGSFIEDKEFNEFKEGVNTEISNLHADIEGSLRPAVESNSEDIEKLSNDVNRIDTNVGELTSAVANLEHSVEGNKEAITDLENVVANKQDQLTPKNAGDNITITGEGSTLKINAEVPGSTSIESSDDSITVTPTETGYDLKVDDSKFIGKDEFTELDGKVATIEGDVNTLKTGKQDALTAGANITISADNVISATGGSSDELKYKTFLVMVPNDRDYMPAKGDSANYLGYNIVVKDSYYDMMEDGWRMFKFDKPVTCSTAQQLVFEAQFTSSNPPGYTCIKESVYHYYKDPGYFSITQPFPFISSFIGLEQHEWYTVTDDMFTKVYGNPTTGDGTVSVGQNQTVLLPADKTHIRAVPGDKIGAGLLGMIIGVKPDAASPTDEKSMIAAFTYFDGRACMYAHLNNGTTIPLSETSGNYVYSPGSGWSGNKNPFIDCLGGNTSTAPFELEKVDRYKIKVTNLTTNESEEIDVSSWPFFQEGGEIRFGFCGYNGNNSGMIVNNIEYFD